MTATQIITANFRQTNVAAGKNLAENQFNILGRFMRKKKKQKNNKQKTSSSNRVLIICYDICRVKENEENVKLDHDHSIYCKCDERFKSWVEYPDSTN